MVEFNGFSIGALNEFSNELLYYRYTCITEEIIRNVYNWGRVTAEQVLSCFSYNGHILSHIYTGIRYMYIHIEVEPAFLEAASIAVILAACSLHAFSFMAKNTLETRVNSL